MKRFRFVGKAHRHAALWKALSLMVVMLAAVPSGVSVARESQMTSPRQASAMQEVACWPSDTPIGALPNQPKPIWCYTGYPTGSSTFVSGTNSWLDEFDSGLSLADCCPGYRVFEDADHTGNQDGILRSRNWRHGDHWMVDVNERSQTNRYAVRGGSMMRPDRSFRFENGKLVVEADIAAGIEAYKGLAWPEITITTRPEPLNRSNSPTYGYNMFANHYTLGCRFQDNRHIICSMFDNTNRGTRHGGRIWEDTDDAVGPLLTLSGYAGKRGSPTDKAHGVCKVSAPADPDTWCRDRFRLELTKNSLVIFVNGVKYKEWLNIPAKYQLPDELVNGEVYVYYANWINTQTQPARTFRFHWDRLAVNPGTPPSAAPAYFLRQGGAVPAAEHVH